MEDRVEHLISQLRTLSPMPEDDLLTEEKVDAYGKIIDELRQLKDPRAIQPVIESFGYGDGYDVYWTAVHLLEAFDEEEVLPHLIAALRSPSRGSRMWAAALLGWGRYKAAIPHLLALLKDPEDRVRANAVIALGSIGDGSSWTHIKRLQQDPSPEVQHAVEIALTHLQAAVGQDS